MARSKSKTKTDSAAPAAPSLAALRSTAPQETVAVECYDGTTGKSLDGLRIDVATMWSPAGRTAQIRGARHVRRDFPEAGTWDVDTLQEVIERYAMAYAIQGWNLTDAGEAVPVTPDMALEVLSMRGDIYVQVKHGYEKGRAFFDGAAPTP